MKTYGGVIQDGYLWFSNNMFNGLFRMNIKKHTVEFVDKFPEETMTRQGLHKLVFLYKDLLIFLPAFSTHIHIFDLNTYKFTTILMKEVAEEAVADAVMVENNIYIFSGNRECVLYTFNIDDFSLNRSGQFEKEIMQYRTESTQFFITRTSLHGNDKICFAIFGTDILGEWDIYNEKLDVVHTKIEDIFSAQVIGENVWIITRKEKEIYRFNWDGSMKKYTSGAGLIEKGRRFYNRVIDFGGEIIAIPAASNCAVRLENDAFIPIVGDYWVLVNNVSSVFFSTIENGDELWLLPLSTNQLYIYNKKTVQVRSEDFLLSDKGVQEMILKRIFKEKRKEKIVHENEIFTIYDFVQGLCFGKE